MSSNANKSRSLENLMMVRVVRLAELISRLAARKFEAQFGLRNTDLRILNILDGENGVSVNEIARRTHIDKAWISRSLRDLAERGLVGRRTDRSDSRRSVIGLTEVGRETLKKIRPIALREEKELLKGTDASAVNAMLDRLLENAETQFEKP